MTWLRANWFFLAAGATVAFAWMIVYAQASSGFRTDKFVRMIESQIAGNAHVSIGPGTTVTLMQCQCSVKYLGTKIDGHVYEVYLDKLD